MLTKISLVKLNQGVEGVHRRFIEPKMGVQLRAWQEVAVSESVQRREVTVRIISIIHQSAGHEDESLLTLTNTALCTEY